jgi:hypothetical protein
MNAFTRKLMVSVFLLMRIDFVGSGSGIGIGIG